MTTIITDLVKALASAAFLIEEITDREGRAGFTDYDFAEQVLAAQINTALARAKQLYRGWPSALGIFIPLRPTPGDAQD
jgi:hypothetical protein